MALWERVYHNTDGATRLHAHRTRPLHEDWRYQRLHDRLSAHNYESGMSDSAFEDHTLASTSYSTSVRITYFAPSTTPVPSCSSAPAASPCGNTATLPMIGLTGYALITPSLTLGMKNVVSPPRKSSFR
jgi:hypothetical protein